MTNKPSYRTENSLAYWRWVYRTTGGWRGVRWCLNCSYGPIAWKRIIVDWSRDRKMKRMIQRMTPEQRVAMIAMLEGLAHDQ